MAKRKANPAYTLRDLPAEWTEFQVIAKRKGTSAAKMLRDFIIETVKRNLSGENKA